MFYIISKLLAFLTKPIIWIFLLLTTAIIYKKKRKNILYTCLITFYLFSNSFIVDEISRAWEMPYNFPKKMFDVGIVLGQAIRQSLDSSEIIRRYGFFVLPMADARVDVALDVSNRPFLVYKVDLENTRVGGFDVSLIEDFLGALAQHAGLDLHVGLVYGKSPHHVAEAIFKGFAKALRGALEIDPRGSGVPSVKGAL